MKKPPYKYQHKIVPKAKPADPDSGKVTGIVENIIYRSEDTGYTVCSVRMTDKKETVNVVGSCPAMWIGETLTAEGSWSRHKQHGFQFTATTITCVAPTSRTGIERYLASGMIDGIGKVNAKRIVDKFGTDTLRIIEKESKKLQTVEGIGLKRRRLIKESWDNQIGMRDIMIFLQGHGIGAAQSARIFKKYGSNVISRIRANPYHLCTDIWGIGFKTADEIAMSVGIARESELRARAGLVYIMSTFIDEGHCFCTKPELLLHTETILGISVEVLAEALNYELRKGTLVAEDENIFLAKIHEAEVNVVDRLTSILRGSVRYKPIDDEKALPWAEKEIGFKFAPSQTTAIRSAISEKVSIITGGPGVGKTTIIKALVDIFKTRKLTIHLAAPTGRAAKRMAEATGHEAQTIHRLLKFVPAIGGFQHGPTDPISGDVFILDEVSMIDVSLMNHFLSALPDRAVVILVGDIDQLPSVGPGNVLSDLINSEMIPCTRLETIFRQDDRSGIVTNAHRVNSGESILEDTDEESSINPEQLNDFYFIAEDDPDRIMQCVSELLTNRIPNRFGFNPLTEVQLLTPMRRSQLGTENLNAVLQQTLNPKGSEIDRFGKKFRTGDRVMQIRNNYDKDIFNGDIGMITGVNESERMVTVQFDSKAVVYEYADLDELIHAFACTIHKSQGSEYPAVVILLTTQHYKLLQRNLLYTAITRGRKLVCLVGSRKAVNLAIRNNKIKLRQTALMNRLITALTDDK